MAIELATAYLSIVPETSKIAPGINKALGKVDSKATAAAGQKAGSTLASSIGATLSKGLKWTGAAAAAGLGVALTKGLMRLSALDQATAKLSGLGHSAKNVDKIMTDALASVKGTAFGMDEAATTAAGAVAAGIKPGQELERTLKLVADAATIGGSSMGEMGAIFNKVATSGKVQGEVINQLGDRGIPILQLLAAELGVTAAEVSEMSRKGAIDFATFRDAIESGMGGAALKSGETFQGALKNAWAAVGRIGANLLQGVFPRMTEGLGVVTGWLGVLEDKAVVVGDALGDGLNKAVDAITIFKDAASGKSELNEFDGILRHINNAGVWLSETFGGMDLGSTFTKIVTALSPLGVLLAGLAPVLPDLAESFLSLGATVKDAVVPAISEVASAALPAVVDAVVELVPALVGLVNGALPVFVGLIEALVPAAASLVGFLAENLDVLLPLAAAVGGAVLAFKAYRLTMVAVAVAQKGAAIAQRVLNAAMKANPIGLIVTAIGLLVAGIVYLWNTNEGFRDFVLGAWDKIKGAFSAVVDWFSSNVAPVFEAVFGAISNGVSTVIDFVKTNWSWLKFIILGPIIGLVTEIVKHWDKIKGAFVAAFEWVKGVFGALWAGIVNIFGPPLDAVRKIVSVFVGAVVLVFKAIVKYVFTSFRNIWRGLVKIFKPPIEFVAKFVAKWFNNTIAGFKKIWNWIKGTFAKWWKGLKSLLSGPLNSARTAIASVISRIKATFQNIWKWVKGAFKTSWNTLKNVLRGPVDTARAAIGTALDRIKTAFTKAKDSIAKAWDGIKSAMSKPVKWVADKVVNPLIRAFNTVAVAVGQSGNQLQEWNFKGFKAGGYTGSVGVNSVAGVVHGQEYVFDAASVRRAGGPGALERLRDAIRRGWEPGDLQVPGYKAGGWVEPVNAGHSGWNGGRYSSGKWHGGLDYPVPTGTPVRVPTAAKVLSKQYLTTSYGIHAQLESLQGGYKIILAHLSKMPSFPGAGAVVPQGYMIGLSGSTGNSTGPHLHYEVRPPGSGTGIDPSGFGSGTGFGANVGGSFTNEKSWSGFPNPLAWARDLFTGSLGKLKDIAGGPFGEIVGGLPRKLSKGMLDMFKFDDGGWLQPGYTLAYNATGSPEPVLTKQQWGDVRAGRSGDQNVTFNLPNVNPHAALAAAGQRLRRL